MKYNSIERQCLFNSPRWHWYSYNSLGCYPNINNTVYIKRKRLGEYWKTIAVPAEIYMIMKNQGISEIYQFSLIDKVFSMETPEGQIPLWVYKDYPKWAVKD